MAVEISEMLWGARKCNVKRLKRQFETNAEMQDNTNDQQLLYRLVCQYG